MTIKTFGAIAIALATTAAANAVSPLTAYSLTNATYTQNFDSLANAAGTTSQTLPAGFQISETGGGAADDDRYAVGTGSSNSGGIYSFGLAGGTDRALGSLGSGTVAPNYFGGIFTNGLGATITSLSLDYFGEQWRFASNAADSLSFQYLVGATVIDAGNWVSVTALDFAAPQTGATTEGALNGNLAANRTQRTATHLQPLDRQRDDLRLPLGRSEQRRQRSGPGHRRSHAYSGHRGRRRRARACFVGDVHWRLRPGRPRAAPPPRDDRTGLTVLALPG